MPKKLVVRLLVIALAGVVAGSALVVVGALLAAPDPQGTMGGGPMREIRLGRPGGAALAAWLLAVATLLAVAAVALVAWVGALVNAAGLEDKVWFLMLLVTGVTGIGLVGLAVYALAGPDSAITAAPPPAPAVRKDGRRPPPRPLTIFSDEVAEDRP